MISTCADPAGIEDARSHIEAGARSVGRSLAGFRLICRLDCCIAEDTDQARAMVKTMLVASLRSSYPNWQFLQPMGLVVPALVQQAIASSDRARVMATAPLLPDAFAAKLALAGTPEQVTRQVRLLAAIGIQEVVIYPMPLPGQTIEAQITAFRALLAQMP
jgi:alkanesulfonate monooxygenase SsuD/methylene tetrahydromethanopterin reductase-like flavin-dependent oxidoreductase (luciferase family)